ncbi:hypothetical protein HYN48_12000 [Flavobacterium magnum]|uniref:Uncharacterized protein n=1 Tax=Flavobacterium magnum TaxID=2162713 RepID=A0A2S0RGF8_9FLAO|nr:hypothetical protein [Flavobacterium magnum]AWA30746.1 hypothetical protein HYN48_12000 [Flavobacterium magnum]
MENNKIKSVTPFNKVLYFLFIALAGYQFFAKHAYVDSAATLGIALAFDPFNPEQSWPRRPLWQKIWLFAHLGIVGLLFGLGIGIGDR